MVKFRILVETFRFKTLYRFRLFRMYNAPYVTSNCNVGKTVKFLIDYLIQTKSNHRFFKFQFYFTFRIQ